MVNVVAMNYVKEDKVNDFLKLAKELELLTNAKDEGCIRYELFQDVSDPYVFAFIETWESQEALNKHMSAEHFKEIVPQLDAFKEKAGGINLFKKI